LTQAMTDHISASRMGYARSPNGRRENFDHKIYSRMTNTFFMAGDDSAEAMIASIENGFLVDRATNGMEDPKSWGIQLEALVARRIVAGKLTDQYFSPVIITGYVPDILQSISMVSRDFHINGLGMCGKGYKEWVKVTDGGPYLKLKARLA
jgi:TldD protein